MSEEAYIAHDSRWRLLFLLLASLAFGACCLWMVGAFGKVSVGRFSSFELAVGGWVGLLFFGLMLFVIAQRIRRAGVAFRIDANGITHAQMVKQSFTWDEIIALQPVQMGNQPMVCYEVVQERLDRIGGIRAKLAAANRSMTGCSFALAMGGTDAQMPEVVAALERFAPKRLLTTG